VAFAVATFVSYLLNRRWSFQLTDGRVSLRETINFYAINIVAWLVTIGIVQIAEWLFGPLSLLGENVAKFAAVVVILIPKFAGYRDIVFRKALTADGRDPVVSPAAEEPERS
jgi:putative flippase GtrA